MSTDFPTSARRVGWLLARSALLLVIACSRQSPAPPTPSHETSGAGEVPTPSSEAAAFQRARAEHKGVMLELYAAWATPCDELEQALQDPSVAESLTASFVPVRLDITNGTDADVAVQERYGVHGVPALVFVSVDGTVLGRLTRYLDPPQLAAAIQMIASHLPR